MQKGKKIFFNSDQHFGAPTAKESKVREKIFIDWLEHIAPEAEEMIGSSTLRLRPKKFI